MSALIFFVIVLFMLYKGYTFSLNYQLARAGIARPAKWAGFLVILQLGGMPLKFELQKF